MFCFFLFLAEMFTKRIKNMKQGGHKLAFKMLWNKIFTYLFWNFFAKFQQKIPLNFVKFIFFGQNFYKTS